jgi:hypothetical protein
MKKNPRNNFEIVLTTIVIFIAIGGCGNHQEFINPFSDITTLDCRNLIIRNVSLNGTSVEVTLENTCKSCTVGGSAYSGMVMIDKTTGDTVAQTCSSCLSSPPNGKSEKYSLATNLTALPDVKSVKFNFSQVCTDLTYIKK